MRSASRRAGGFLRHFLLEGFNADEAGKRAIDGMFIHVAGGDRELQSSIRATVARCAADKRAVLSDGSVPLHDAPQKEPETGKQAGLLDRAKAAKVLPKIFHTNTFLRILVARGSLIHTSPDGKRDVAPMENARIYHVAGLQHFSRAFRQLRTPSRASLRNICRTQIRYGGSGARCLWRWMIGCARERRRRRAVIRKSRMARSLGARR
jgi:hypothetical protein